MKTKGLSLLVAGIVISFLTTQAQITSKTANTSSNKLSTQKSEPPVAKSREFTKLQRKQRINDRRKIRREAKLYKRIDALVLRMTGGYAYLSAP